MKVKATIKIMLRDRELRERLDALAAKLDRVLEAIDMADKARSVQGQEILTLIGEVNTSTNAVASRIDALIARLGNNPDAAETAAIKDELQTLRDRLAVLGADPENPIPPE